MVIHNAEELKKIERRRNDARKRLVNKKPSLRNIEHIDHIKGIERMQKATQKTLSLDDNKNCKLKDFVED